MKFYKLYTLLNEAAIGFADLPDTFSYYGFWISPMGDMYLVKTFQDHAKESKKIIMNNPFYAKKFMDHYDLATYGKSNIDDFGTMYFKDFIYENLGFMRIARLGNSFYASVHQRYTEKQKSTYDDLAMLYNYGTSKIEVD